MTVEAVAHAMVEKHVVDEAEAIYAAAGMTLDEAFRLLLMRTAAEQAVPFDPLIPNAETIEAMKAARRGDVVRVESMDELFERLHAED